MYCFNGACTCLSDYVAIAGYCWPKVNPGDRYFSAKYALFNSSLNLISQTKLSKNSMT